MTELYCGIFVEYRMVQGRDGKFRELYYNLQFDWGEIEFLETKWVEVAKLREEVNYRQSNLLLKEETIKKLQAELEKHYKSKK